jgi:hypothetical protein
MMRYHLQLTDQRASFQNGFLRSPDTGSSYESHCLGYSSSVFNAFDTISKITSFAIHDNCGTPNRTSCGDICWRKSLNGGQ